MTRRLDAELTLAHIAALDYEIGELWKAIEELREVLR